MFSSFREKKVPPQMLRKYEKALKELKDKGDRVWHVELIVHTETMLTSYITCSCAHTHKHTHRWPRPWLFSPFFHQ